MKTNEEFKTGTRVRVRQPNDRGQWHTAHGQAYTHECQPGYVGVVLDDYGLRKGHVLVQWDRDQNPDLPPLGRTRAPGQQSAIDTVCLEVDDFDAEIQAAIASITRSATTVTPAVVPVPAKHCPTCTC